MDTPDATTGYSLWVDGERVVEWGSYVERVHHDGCVGNPNGVYDFSGFGLDRAPHENIGATFNYTWGYVERLFQGYMQDIRLVKRCLYTENFRPPTLLLNNPC